MLERPIAPLTRYMVTLCDKDGFFGDIWEETLEGANTRASLWEAYDPAFTAVVIDLKREEV